VTHSERQQRSGEGRRTHERGSGRSDARDGRRRPVKVNRRWFLAGLAGVAAGAVGIQQLARSGGGDGSVAGSGGRTERSVPSFPIRTVDEEPEESLQEWVITVDGMAERKLTIDFDAWEEFARFEEVADFPCVEGWTVEDVRWGGVRPMDVIAAAGPAEGATHAVFHAYDGEYTDCLPFDQLEEPGSILADRLDGKPLPVDHGGPVRLVVPSQLAYKSVKFVRRIELTDRMVQGYWEVRGYPADAPVET